jgi:GNAT superfamily N-acetyltransferase
MTTAPTIEVRRFDTLDEARGDLIDVYAEVRAPLLHLPNYATTAFGERLDRHGHEPGFVAVLAYADGQAVGYAYANTIERGDRYWQRTTPEPPEQYLAQPAVALKEIGVRPAWRGTGTALRIHDILLLGRDEPYVTLMVNSAAGDGKVHALYRSWGYEDLGHSQPSPASPQLTVMIRPTR